MANTPRFMTGFRPRAMVSANACYSLTSTPEGACDYIDADLRDTGRILDRAAGTLDFTRPVALMMLGILGQIPDSDHPGSVIGQLMSVMASGTTTRVPPIPTIRAARSRSPPFSPALS